MIQKGDAGLEIDKERYKRNILLPEVGEEGQKKLAESRGTLLQPFGPQSGLVTSQAIRKLIRDRHALRLLV